MNPHRGFTLVETLMVMVVIGLATVTIARVQGGLFANQSTMRSLQVGTGLMQECAEQVLGVRRWTLDGYNAVSSTTFATNACGGVAALPGSTVPSVTLASYTGTACPPGATCKTATITQNGLTPVTVMLVDY